MKPAVTVVVPFHNVEPFFEKCLRSLFGQTLRSLEYIFVDDASPDGSLALLERVLEEYPDRRGQVTILRNERNLGCPASRARGMRVATGEYLISCDADDWVEPQAYDTLYAAAREHAADMVCCGFFWETASGSRPWRYPEALGGRLIEGFVPGMYWQTYVWNKLLRTAFFRAYARYPVEGVSTWEDRSLIVPLLCLSRRTIVLPEVLYHYNRLNKHSGIVYKPRNVDSMIRCAAYLEGFFRGRGLSERYAGVVNHDKFMAKNPLLLRREARDIPRWRRTFPEAHAFIWRLDGSFSRQIKTIYWLVAHGMAWLGCPLLDLKLLLAKKLGRES